MGVIVLAVWVCRGSKLSSICLKKQPPVSLARKVMVHDTRPS